MNRWDCDHPGCTARAVGSYGAIGLRAIGWYFEVGPVTFCPEHRPDPIPCVHEGADEEQRGKPCSQCKAEAEARRIQELLTTDEDRATAERLRYEPIVVDPFRSLRRSRKGGGA